MNLLNKADGSRVLSMLCPQGGWSIVGNEYENITWIDDNPLCTKEQFELGFSQYEIVKEQEMLEQINKKAAAEAKLAALGLTTDDLKALGIN